MTNEPSLPNYKQKILHALAEYKFLSSKQVWDKTGAAMEGKSFNQTQVELNKLKKAGLVRLARVEGENGGGALHQWVLERAGARLINFDNFGRHYQRPLNRYKVEMQKVALDLEEQVELALGDWKLIKSQPYSSTRPLPETTAQFDKLCKVLTWQEYERTGSFPSDDRGPHTLMVPLQANQYVAYLKNETKAVIFIAPHPRATERFWMERSKEYGRLAELIPTYVVYGTREQTRLAEKVLGKFKFKALSVGQVSGLLSRFQK
jgi:hypothetical protein